MFGQEKESLMALWAGGSYGRRMSSTGSSMVTMWPLPLAGPGDQAWRGDEPPLPQEGGQAVWLPAEELPGPGEGGSLLASGALP